MSERIRDLKVEHLGISTLKPYARNARTHTNKQIRQIAASIETFGWTNPILIDQDRQSSRATGAWQRRGCSGSKRSRQSG